MGYGCNKLDITWSLCPISVMAFGSLSRIRFARQHWTNMHEASADIDSLYSIKKPKTNRYPSLNGVDPKFRRNHRHALHGTAKALVR